MANVKRIKRRRTKRTHIDDAYYANNKPSVVVINNNKKASDNNKNKRKRNKRLRDFETHVLDGLRMYLKVEKRDNGSYTVHTRDVGIIDFFPKADKICFREDNSWINNGCEWICNNL